MVDGPILVINAGSSSLKPGLFGQLRGDEQSIASATVDELGRKPVVPASATHSATLASRDMVVLQQEALTSALEELWSGRHAEPVAIGHRVVHGGPSLVRHQEITPKVLQELWACTHFAPLHIPLAIQLIEATQRLYPGTPQFACFDTAFHRDIPESAAAFPLPEAYFSDGIKRYGFHGLSYESIVHRLGIGLPARTVIAHLGNGASLVALLHGRSMDTSMGLTPTGGIPMSTRTGDLDPGLLLFLMRIRGFNPDTLESLLNQQSGLRGLSGISGDMRELEQAAQCGSDPARLAISVFSRAISKTVAAYAAVLGGIDALIFTGGIGMHSSKVRSDVCERLAFLGMEVDEFANHRDERIISTIASTIAVWVVPTEEDLQIARHARALLTAGLPKPTS